MIKKTFNIFQNKIVLKYLLLILVLFIPAGTIYLLKYSTNENKSKHSKTEIRNLFVKGDKLCDTYHFTEAYYYYNKAQALCDTDTQYIDFVYAINSMADIEQVQGDYVACELLLMKTLPYLEKIKKPRFTANVYESFAANYYYKFDYNNALLYLRKALHLKISSYRKIIMLNSICQIYVRQKKFKLAESILIPLSKIKTIYKHNRVTNDAESSRILDDLGLCYQAQRKPEALDCYKKSVVLKLRIKDDYGLLYSYMHIAEYYQESNHLTAVFYAKKSLALATRFNDAPNRLQSLKILSKTSEKNELKKYAARFIKLADSIANERQKEKKQFTNVKYNFQNDKNENLQLKALKIKKDLQLERQKRRTMISYIVILLILAVITFIYFRLSLNVKKGKNEAIYKSEIRISRKLNDELAKDVYQTLVFVKNSELEVGANKEELLNNLQNIYSQTRNISKENSKIVINENYTIALKEMISEFKNPDIHLLINGLETISWNEIDKNKKITIYRILQELLINMKKHSYATLVGITFKKIEKSIFISYTNNAKGIDIANLTLQNGLYNVENRILAIKGVIQIESKPEKGFKVFFKIPL